MPVAFQPNAFQNNAFQTNNYPPGSGPGYVYAVTIAGVSKQILDGWGLRETVNGRNALSFGVLSVDGSYRPAKHDEVVLTEGGVRIFAGNIDQPSETGTGHGGTAMTTTCSAVDFNALADRRFFTGVIPAGTLKAALQQIDDLLTAYGVTLDPAQVDGPGLPDITAGYSRLDQLLNHFSVLGGGYIWEIDYNKTLRMFLPGAAPAPFNLIDGDGNALGDITVTPSRNQYANKVYVIGGGEVPYVATASDGGPASLLIEDAIRYPDILDAGVLDALAPQDLARRLLQPRTVTYSTKRTGLKPGMTQQLTIPAHGISAVTFLIVEIETKGESVNDVIRTITLVEGSLNAPDWREVYRTWAGGGTGTGTIITGSGGPSIAVGTTYLGGSRNTSVAPSPAAWMPVPEYVPFTAQATFGGRVRAQIRARNAGVTVTCRLFNVTDSTVVAVSSGVTSTTATEVTFLTGITVGKTYRLEVLSSAGAEGVFGIGVLERA